MGHPEGSIWCWGQGSAGQLGTKGLKVEDVPTPAKTATKFWDISCWKNYSLALSADFR